MSGGVVSTVLLHPLDLLKIRFAVNDGRSTARPTYAGIKNAVVSIGEQCVVVVSRAIVKNLNIFSLSWQH